MIRNQRDLLTGLLFLAIGGLAIQQGMQYSIGSASAMGPGFFPIVLGGGLVALALILLVRSFKGRLMAVSRIAIKPLFFITLALSLFALLLEPAGLLVTVVLTAFVGSMAGHEFDAKSSLLIATILSIGCVLTFVVGLGQQIPVLGWWFGGY